MTESEYNRCVDAFADRVFRFILKNVGNRAEAEDIVQIAFEKVWRHRETVSFEKSKSFLFTTAYRSMIDWIRKYRRISFQEDISDHVVSVSHQPKANLSEVIEKAMEQLSEIQKSVLMLRDYEGYSYKEIADLTGISESQVKVYIFRARKKMKSFIVKLENVI